MSDDSAKFPASENQEHSASESLEPDAVEVQSEDVTDVTSADGIGADALDVANDDAIASIENSDMEIDMEMNPGDLPLDDGSSVDTGEPESVPDEIPESVPEAVLDEEMAAIQEYYGSDVTPTELAAELAAQAEARSPATHSDSSGSDEPVPSAPAEIATGPEDTQPAGAESVEPKTVESEHTLYELEMVSQDLDPDRGLEATPPPESDAEPAAPPSSEERATPTTPPSASPTPAAATSQASKGVAQQVWSRVQPVLKSSTVWSLQTAVRGLNWSTVKLDSAQRRPQEPGAGARPPSTVQKIGGIVLAALVTTSLLLVRSLSNLLQWGLRNLDANALPQETVPASEPTPVESAASSLWEKIAPILTQLWRLWRRFLAVLRDRILPDSLKRLSDLTLTVLAAAILATVLWITSAITSGGGTPSVAKTPPPAERPVAAPSRGPATAQQKAVVAAQEDISELVGEYNERLAQTVETDIQGDRLIVTLGYDWYRLEPDQQNRLTRDLLRRSQRLDFEALEVLDPEGIRVARSPVVGSQMIIFKRTSETLPEEPAVVEPAPELTSEPTPEPLLNEPDTADLEELTMSESAAESVAESMAESELSE